MGIEKQVVSRRTTESFDGADNAPKRPYAIPTIQRMGNLYEVTLGGSPGGGDSGNPTEANLARRGDPPHFPMP